MINDKIISTLLVCILALGGWTLSRTFSISQDMVLVKEKISQMEKQLDEAVWNSLQDDSHGKKKKKKR